MYATKEDSLSPDELRKRLYQTFKNKGVLDTLKTQLRNQLIQELQHRPVTGGQPVPRPVPGKSEPLMVTACNSIVADHLSSSGYEYSLSVFYPESSLCKEKVFTKENLLQLLKISPESSLYRSLSSNKDNNDKGFLINLLTQLTHHYTHGLCHDADTQTTSIASYGDSLVDKMKMIDKEYENLSCSGDKLFPLQSKLAAYRKEIEAQLQAEMSTQLQHFKDVEIAKVKMEEKSKFHKEFDKLKQELDRTYEMKTKALMEREKNAIDRLQKQQEIEEKNVYMHRQLLLKEIETQRNRENELRMRMEAFEKTCQIHEEKVKATEELMRRRELGVRTMEDTHDQRLKNELSRCQFELKEEFLKRTEKLTENENRNKAETARIQRESAVLDSQLEEHSRACSELRRLQVELDTAQQQIPLLTQQKELLRERVETMSDYTSLKREKAELQGQLRLLKNQLDEAQEENRLLHADLSKPSKEQLSLQLELLRLQSARRLDEEEFNSQKQELQARLQREVEHCTQLKAQLIECEETLQWIKNHVEDVKIKLRQTQQALENEVLCNSKLSLVDRSVLELHADKLVPPDIYVNRALLRARAGYDDICGAGGPLRRLKSPRSDSPDSDMELVAEAKARIQELQREETLEEAYRNYQQRAVLSTISHMLPLRPLSPQQPHPSHRPSSPPRRQVSHHSYARSPHKSKVSHRPSSPQRLQTPSSSAYDTRNTLPPAQPRVTFLEAHNQPQSTVFTEHSLHSLTEPVFLSDGHHQDEISAPTRRLSSTPHSPSRKKLQRETVEEPVVSPVPFPELSSDRQLALAPREEGVTSGDSSSEFSSPRSPQLKSTARDQPSPPQMQPVLTSSDSSPQPDRISLEDLTGILSEPGHIPELLLDTAVPLTEEAPDGPAVPRPRDLPEDPMDSQGPAEVPQTAGDSAREEEEDDEAEEQRWERERKERQERRQREQEEARWRELHELERLEKETVMQEEEHPGQEEEEEERGNKTEGDEEQEDDVEEPEGENPLEKYMKMVLEAREKQPTQSSGREEAGHTSPEAKSLFEDKEDSIAAFSHKDEDDEFW
ncbi:oral-facial-digital syndrome 1 protein homolog isoform X2 [Hippoglossus hippoglossus]|uniref:oral-facial-digital syndrome 1 protein homolog isoform X2 n=1 Tax=Hippoglossus hippoglossus TaxID=8267 RepID=UPI00148D02A5|nr:oral-facial-digital syndrome 1 protein homolog isoform X2 [Hippoglossus hippoglossus]XP_034430470.1 oral-facial-digital syndrome 1 protein homolog isoform X2 [Hippoglossus hippoglossus]